MNMTLDLPESIDESTSIAPAEPSQGPAEPAIASTQQMDDDDFSDISGEQIESRENAARAKAKADYEKAVVDAESQLVEANLREDELKGELKAAKSHRTECLERLQRIKMRGADGFYMPPPKPPTDDGEDDAPEEDTSWRLIPTEDVIGNIDGMGKTKLEAITDQFPNLGALEDARAEASKAHKSFDKVLPKGVGGQLAENIENTVMDAIAKHVAKPEVDEVIEEEDGDSDE